MKTIVRVVAVSLSCSAIAGWSGASLFREYSDYLVPATLMAIAGALVGAIAGAAFELSRPLIAE